MSRIERVDVANEIYHVINRANARVQIFDNESDYKQFESILEEAVEKDEAQTEEELESIRKSINKNIPFGGNI